MKKKAFVYTGIVVVLASLFLVYREHSFLNEGARGGEQKSVYAEEAKNLPDAQLTSKIIEGLTALSTSSYNTTLGFQMSAYVTEYNTRKINTPAIEKLIDDMFQKYGPCWGIPEGECRE